MIKKGQIYIIADKNDYFVKIGRTQDVNSRLSTLRTGNSDLDLRLIFTEKTGDCVIMEGMVHGLFDSERTSGVTKKFNKSGGLQRVSGEWYYFDGLVKEFVDIAQKSGLMDAIEHVATQKKSFKRKIDTPFLDLIEENTNYRSKTVGSEKLVTS